MRNEKRVTSDTHARIALYKQDPLYYQSRIRKRFGKRNVAIAVSYIETRETLRAVGKQYNVSPERVRQIYARFLRFVFQASLRRKKPMEPEEIHLPIEVPQTVKRPRGVTASLTQEEFDRVKQLLWEGNTIKDIAEVVKRHTNTIFFIARAKTLEEYWARRKAKAEKYYKKTKPPRLTTVAPPAPEEEPHESFIEPPIVKPAPVERIQALQQELFDMIDTLVKENRELKDRLATIQRALGTA